MDYVKNQGGKCVSRRLYEVLHQFKVSQGDMLVLLTELEEMGFIRMHQVYF
jgi:hypothetical protein